MGTVGQKEPVVHLGGKNNTDSPRFHESGQYDLVHRIHVRLGPTVVLHDNGGGFPGIDTRRVYQMHRGQRRCATTVTTSLEVGFWVDFDADTPQLQRRCEEVTSQQHFPGTHSPIEEDVSWMEVPDGRPYFTERARRRFPVGMFTTRRETRCLAFVQ